MVLRHQRSDGRPTNQQGDRTLMFKPSCKFLRQRARHSIRLPVLTCILFLGLPETPFAAESYWPQWRGPLGTGVAPDANPPVQWSEDENVRWKVQLPGLGHSTPIVWQDRVYVTCAVPHGDPVAPFYSNASGAHDNLPVTSRQRFVVLAIDRGNGKVVWQRNVGEALPHEGGHYTASFASNSPVTDGRHVFACFGSYGLFCLDQSGTVVWQLDMGDMQSRHGHGEGSSPVLHGNVLVMNWDHEGKSFVVALDKETGRQRWKVKRDEVTSWATPIVVQHGGLSQLIVSGTNRVRAYNLSDGRVVWECGGLSRNIVASPVASDGMVYVGSSYDTRAMLAITLDGARGDITGTDKVAWSRSQRTPYVPSPLLYDNKLYFLRHYQGILTRLDAKTGEETIGPFRLSGIQNVYASPVGAANRVYVTDLKGVTAVFSHNGILRPLSLNHLEDSFSASAAIAGSDLFLRGRRHLYCLAEN